MTVCRAVALERQRPWLSLRESWHGVSRDSSAHRCCASERPGEARLLASRREGKIPYPVSGGVITPGDQFILIRCAEHHPSGHLSQRERQVWCGGKRSDKLQIMQKNSKNNA